VGIHPGLFYAQLRDRSRITPSDSVTYNTKGYGQLAATKIAGTSRLA
jgi:hypothetical protein